MKPTTGAWLLIMGTLPFVQSCRKATPPAPPTVNIDVDGTNAAVPANLRDKLKFGKRQLIAKSTTGTVTYSLAAPMEWVEDGNQLPGEVELHPPYEQGFGNLTHLRLKSSCGGACVAKDWAPVAAAELSKFGSPVTTVREEKLPQSHLRLTDAGDTLYFEYAFWYPGSTQYFSCDATLSNGALPGSPDPRPALADFENACRAVNVGFDSR